MDRDPSVEVIIPHMSRWDLLERLLESIDEQTKRPRVCVVDNASTDDSLERLSAREDVRVRALERNLGFGKAVNEGVRTSEARNVILLNNDMVIEPEFVANVCELLDAELCSVATLQVRGDGLIDTIGVGCDQSLIAFDVGHGEAPDAARAAASQILGPSGGAAGFRRDSFLSVGGYDEAIFAYLEDLDLAIRLNAAGVPVRFCENAVAHHLHSATLGSGSTRKNELLGWSRGYIVWKYRHSLSLAARVRGTVIDLVVYGGKLVVDRNLGSFTGRLRFFRERRSHATEDRIELETTNSSLTHALSRRLARR